MEADELAALGPRGDGAGPLGGGARGVRGVARRGRRPHAPASGWRRRCGGWARTRPASSGAPGPTRCSGGPATATGAVAVRAVAGHHLQGELRQLRGRQRLDRPGRAAARAARAGGPLHGLGVGGPRPTGWPTSTRPRRSPSGRSSVARAAGDVDLELVALSQLGLIRVGQGDTAAGFALIDEAMAAALGGERVEPRHRRLHLLRHAQRLRAGQRPRAGRPVVPGRRRLRRDATAARSSTPSAASTTAACWWPRGGGATPSGSWARRCASPTARCPGLHRQALARLAGLRIRQGRLEEADQLLADVGGGTEAEAEATLAGGGPAAGPGRRGAAAAACSAPASTAWRATARSSPTRSTCSSTPTWPPATLDGQPRERLAATAGRDGRRRAATASTRWPRRAGAGSPRPAATPRRPSPPGGGGRAVVDPLALPFEAARDRFDLGRVPCGERSRRWPIDHARRALAAFEQLGAGARRRPGRRPSCARWASSPAPARRESALLTAPGAGGAAAAGRRAVEPRDRRAPAHEPQDRLPPRQQHPQQAAACATGPRPPPTPPRSRRRPPRRRDGADLADDTRTDGAAARCCPGVASRCIAA